jgi:hypothetical protein
MKKFSRIQALVLSAILGVASAVSAVTVTVDANQVVRKADRHRIGGSNLAIWYNASSLQDPEMIRLFKDIRPGILRIPGGGSSDGLFWNGNGVRGPNGVDKSRYNPKTYTWNIDYSDWQPGFFGFTGFPKDPMKAEIPSWHGNCTVKDMHEFVKAVGAETLVIVNAGTGTPRDAAEWVRWANKKMGYNVKYWEIGNELGGSWENGHIRPDGREMNGEIYAQLLKEFSIAMKKADPTIKVGAQISADWVEPLLRIAGDNVDFINEHIYFFSGAATPADMFASYPQIISNNRKMKDAIRKVRPDLLGKIELGLSEYNSKLFEDIHTADLFSGVWLSAALAEQFAVGQDMSMQWDSFTQKQNDGGGHGFILDATRTPKAEYWAFWLFNHWFGDTMVAAASDDPRLKVYASKGDAGETYLMVVNTSETQEIVSRIGLKGVPAGRAASAARFSQIEYRWSVKDFAPAWNSGPTILNIPSPADGNYAFPPLSTTVIKWSAPQTAESVTVLGRSAKAVPLGTKSRIEVLALKADGSPASGAAVTLEATGTFKASALKAVAGADGRAVFEITAPSAAGSSEFKFASGSSTAVCSVRAVQAGLKVFAPEKVPLGTRVQVEVVPCWMDGTKTVLFEEFPYVCTLSFGSTKLTGKAVNGTIRFDAGALKSGTSVFTAEVADLKIKSAPVQTLVFNEVETPKIICKFDQASDLRYVGGKTKFTIDQNIRPNQGVLSVELQKFSGWAQDWLNFVNLKEIPNVDWSKVIAMTFEVYLPADYNDAGQYANLVMCLQSTANYWMPLEAYNLNGVKKGEWTKVRLDIKPEFRSAMGAFFQMMTIFSCGGPMTGHIYFDNLGVVMKVQE